MTDDDDIEGLAAEYVLGSLGTLERAEVAGRRTTDAALDAAITAWEARLGPLSTALPGIEPPGYILGNVLRQVDTPISVPLASMREGSRRRRSVRRWLALSAGASALAACLVGALLWVFEAPVRIPARFVSELEKTPNPTEGLTVALVPLGFEVFFDLRASTVLVRPFAVPPGSSQDYQLWLIPHGTAAPPISLGVIPLAEPTMSPWPATYPPRDLVHARLAVSLEPRGGSPKGIPTGPTMFEGKLVQASYPLP